MQDAVAYEAELRRLIQECSPRLVETLLQNAFNYMEEYSPRGTDSLLHLALGSIHSNKSKFEMELFV
jgi:hypothetical protein